MHGSYKKGGETVAATVLAEESEREDSAQLMVYNHDTGSGRVVELPLDSTVTFGRSRTCTVTIESERVSRNHAQVARTDEKIVVSDLGSRNGTKLNGELIDGEVTMTAGDALEVGPILAVLSTRRSPTARAVLGDLRFFEERLAAECDRSNRYRRPLAVVMIRIEGDEDVIDEQLAKLIARARPMDIAAEYSPDEIAFIFPEATRQEAEATIKDIAKMMSDSGPGVQYWIGCAVLPENGSDPGALIDASRSALRSARKQSSGAVSFASAEMPESKDDPIVLDPKMIRVYELAGRVAESNITVLITGETGSGKELVAESIRNRSARADKPFIRINCACLTETLLESELFGHEKGAFTGADQRKIGYFEAGNEGTIFLDEIGEMPLSLQTKLLRVLEERSFTRVGGTTEIEVDVRVVCATHRDLSRRVRDGAFREDLYFRVSGFTIAVPPLRERQPEILPLANSFLEKFAKESNRPPPIMSQAVANVLTSYGWPGNVRELRNAMERAAVLSRGTVELTDLPGQIIEPIEASESPTITGAASGMRETIADVEKRSIAETLHSCDGNQTQAAKRLGISRRSLIYKMEKYGLKPKPKSRS